MIEKLSLSDLEAILSRLKDENTRIWYRINSSGEMSINSRELQSEHDSNERLIREIEEEIESRVNKLKKAGN